MKVFELEHILGVNFKNEEGEVVAFISQKYLESKFHLILSKGLVNELSEHQFLLFLNFINQKSFKDLLNSSKKVLKELASTHYEEYDVFNFELHSITYLGGLMFEIGFYLDFGCEADNYGCWKARFERDMLVRVEREQL